MIPTCSNMEQFEKHLANPNTDFSLKEESATVGSDVRRIKKNIVLSLVSDPNGCGHIRNIFPLSYLNSEFGKYDKMHLIMSPFPIVQPDILAKCRSVFFQRWYYPHQLNIAHQYKELQKKYKFKMVYDIDDFIWIGKDIGEGIPKYNSGGDSFGEINHEVSIEIMNMMDTVCVSTEFLKIYLTDILKIKSEIKVINNAIPKFLWSCDIKQPIAERIKVPRIIYTGSITHYNNTKTMKGDWDNAWLDWVIKNVKEKKIKFICMGGMPFFFESIKDHENFKFIPWVNSFSYHLPVMKLQPDFGIAPLVPNYFNYSKSFIKYQEYCAVGAVGVGTTFSNGKPSPYDVCKVSVSDTVTVDELDDLILNKGCEPEFYNETIKYQYKQMQDSGWWMESPQYINQLIKIL